MHSALNFSFLVVLQIKEKVCKGSDQKSRRLKKLCVNKTQVTQKPQEQYSNPYTVHVHVSLETKLQSTTEAAAFIKAFAAVPTVVAIAIENKCRDGDEATHKIKLMY